MNYMFIFMVAASRQWMKAFFDRLGGWKMKKDTAKPPGRRRILKKGRL